MNEYNWFELFITSMYIQNIVRRFLKSMWLIKFCHVTKDKMRRIFCNIFTLLYYLVLLSKSKSGINSIFVKMRLTRVFQSTGELSASIEFVYIWVLMKLFTLLFKVCFDCATSELGAACQTLAPKMLTHTRAVIRVVRVCNVYG